MPLLGKGALMIWHDIVPEGEVDYNEWHSKEHMLERIGVPGFLRGHRYGAESASPRYVNFYEVEDIAVLTSQPYLDRLNDPTPWTRRALPYFRNNSRTLCRVVASFGQGVPGRLLTLAISPGEQPDALRAWLVDEALPGLLERPGIIGAHLLEGDPAASRTETAERRLRGQADAVADWVVLVGAYEPDALEQVARDQLSDASLGSHGGTAAARPGIYRLMHCITKADLPA